MEPASITLREKSVGFIMGGGAGSRLYPLTQKRSKPAVPLGGKYRLVDIPISNCINSELNHVYVLTQYNSASLNRHITNSYKFDHFSNGFVEVLAAQQTPDGTGWYQGTADAVRQNLQSLNYPRYEYCVILSGDQLYRMDFRKMMQAHIQCGAELTVATLPVDRQCANGFGIMQTNTDGRIEQFVEKPTDEQTLDKLKMPKEILEKFEVQSDGEPRYQASMGIYIFNKGTLLNALNNDKSDFGRDVIPSVIKNHRVFSYIFNGYWEDIGTIGSFFQANLDLTKTIPPFDFFDEKAQIYTNARFLPASKVNGASVENAILSDGCVITHARLKNCVVGVRSIIESDSIVENSVIMGADFYQGQNPRGQNAPPPSIGKNCIIRNAIIDKNVSIGDGCVISPEGKNEGEETEFYCVRDGVIVIPKSTVVPPGTWI